MLGTTFTGTGRKKLSCAVHYTDKKETKIPHILYTEIKMRSGAKSYMRKGFLRYEEMHK
jgi:hypothetical protein